MICEEVPPETDLAVRRVEIADRTSRDSCDQDAALDARRSDREQAFPRGDDFDSLSAMMIPDSVVKNAPKLIEAQAEKIFKEGARGPVARAMLSRDIAVGRAHLQLYQALADHEVQRVGRGKADTRKARFYLDLVQHQHRRLLASTELLLRLEVPSVPSVRVIADRAAFVLSADKGSNSV